jgi:hypothetical protein
MSLAVLTSQGHDQKPMFYDLNLPESGKERIAAGDRLRLSLQLDYACVAFAHVALDRLTDRDR